MGIDGMVYECLWDGFTHITPLAPRWDAACAAHRPGRSGRPGQRRRGPEPRPTDVLGAKCSWPRRAGENYGNIGKTMEKQKGTCMEIYGQMMKFETLMGKLWKTYGTTMETVGGNMWTRVNILRVWEKSLISFVPAEEDQICPVGPIMRPFANEKWFTNHLEPSTVFICTIDKP